ncbi:ABC transporter permease [Methanospirillum sp.]|jgi:hypothetical protein|uniref:ABC transporter permease n=1 Tax=Methanospirillum sp. TaxID=45200 RepID=UPI0026122CC9|nr:ABC transporter permease [Methanospirillum sp.]
MQETVHNRFIVMNILFLISVFGMIVFIFLWLRDIRIWTRSLLPGYRKASIHGVYQAALATAGAGIVYVWPHVTILGTGIVLLALYLQGREEREKIWTDEPAITRFFGSVPRNNARK